MRSGRQLSVALVIGTMLGVLSCGNDTTNPQDVVLSQQTAQEAGSLIADQAADLVDAFTFDGTSDVPIGTQGMLVRQNVLLQRWTLEKAWRPRWLAADSCATFSDTTDTDQDGIPDDLTVSFGAPGCTVAVGESLTVALSGSFRVTDRGTDPGFDITYTSVRLRVDHTSGDFADLRLNGTQGVGATSSGASLAENLTSTIDLRANGVSHHGAVTQNWTAAFTASPGATFDPGLPLPSGDLDVAGSTTWVADGQSLAFALSAPTPLAHEQGCTQPPPFESGILRALVTGNRVGAFVRVQFTGCGQAPVITLVGQSTP